MTEADFLKIKNWLLRNARTLESARFAYLFETIDVIHVIDTLKAYQNNDGGFGHGLESDFICLESSPMQCWTALEIIEEIGYDNAPEITQNLINYLLDTAPMEEGKWLSKVPSINDYPHAPWWHFTEADKIWGYNPTAALAGFVLKYTEKSTKEHEAALKIAQGAIKAFLTTEITEMHELRSFVELHRYLSCETPCDNFLKFSDKLKKTIMSIVEQDETKWFSTYCIRPSQFVIGSEDLGYSVLKPLFDKELDMIMKQRNDEGVWNITWNWGQYPEAYPIAKKNWQGVLVVSYLKFLKAFGKL